MLYFSRVRSSIDRRRIISSEIGRMREFVVEKGSKVRSVLIALLVGRISPKVIGISDDTRLASKISYGTNGGRSSSG